MTLHHHKEIILKWILSCTTFEQLDLINEIISQFVVNRFKDISDSFDLEIVRTELIEAVEECKMSIIKSTHIPQTA